LVDDSEERDDEHLERHAEARMIDAGPTRLCREVRGSGRPLLCITGGTGDAGEWGGVAPVLADEYMVIAYDRRGFSRSPRLAGCSATSMAGQAEDAAALLRALGLTPAVVIGHSGGGSVACELVARHPHVVGLAVIYEAPLFAVVPHGEQIADALLGSLQPAMTEGGPHAAPETFVRIMAGDEAVDFFAASDREQYERVLDNGAVLLTIELPVFATFVPDRDRLRATGLSLTVVMAEEGRESWSGTASRWPAAGTGAELLELPGGHVGFLADPAGLVELLDRVAGSHMPAAGGGS
jgi:pimeloyl-ACP methyl ester carboxylesterase